MATVNPCIWFVSKPGDLFYDPQEHRVILQRLWRELQVQEQKLIRSRKTIADKAARLEELRRYLDAIEIAVWHDEEVVILKENAYYDNLGKGE